MTSAMVIPPMQNAGGGELLRHFSLSLRFSKCKQKENGRYRMAAAKDCFGILCED